MNKATVIIDLWTPNGVHFRANLTYVTFSVAGVTNVTQQYVSTDLLELCKYWFFVPLWIFEWLSYFEDILWCLFYACLICWCNRLWWRACGRDNWGICSWWKLTPKVQSLIKILLKYGQTQDFRAIIFVEWVVSALVLPKVELLRPDFIGSLWLNSSK